jgi:transposase-like protein
MMAFSPAWLSMSERWRMLEGKRGHECIPESTRAAPRSAQRRRCGLGGALSEQIPGWSPAVLPRRMRHPFQYFNSLPDAICLVVMMYVRYPLSLRNVEGLQAERGIDLSHETVRFWWNRFGPVFAAEIRKRRVTHMRGYPQWRWHLDKPFVNINGKLCYLWRAVDHEGEVLEAVVTARRDKAAGLKLLKRIIKKYGRPQTIVTDRASCVFRGDERNWRRLSARGRWPAQQSGGKFSSAVSTALSEQFLGRLSPW